MIKRFFEWVISPMGRVAAIIGGLAFFSLAAYGISITQTPPDQPIQFPHNLHVGFGVQCLYCHPGALRGPSPGLPTQSKCWGCHQQIEKTFTSEKLAYLVDKVRNNQPIVWIPVAQVPDFVHFTHRPHIAAGLNCETCHGDVSKMEIYENPQVLNMGWCLQCHRNRTENNLTNNPTSDPAVTALLDEKRTKLTDCGTCHY
ncbi:MAG TPA: cytochrome c3 family protein [Anaerolineales bacterium]|nr:cytochrome c3 family protein [Anaerolineales bacterium]